MMRKTILTLAVAACAAIGASAQQPPRGAAPADQPPVFRGSTRLVVNTVVVRDKAGKIIEGLTDKDFIVTEDNERQQIAFVEFQRLVGEAAPGDAAVLTAPSPAPAAQAQAPPTTPEVSSVVDVGIAAPAPGDIKYRNRRLLILYFDQTATSPPDLMRVYDGALKYIAENMQPADLVALMSYTGNSVRVKQDFTDNKAKLKEVIQILMYGEDKDGDGVRDPDIEGTEFGQNDAEFNVFSTDRQLAALQTAVGMLRPFPEQKSLIYFASNLRLNGTDNNAQLRATTNAAIRSNVAIFPVDARGLVAMAPLGDATQRSPGGVGMFSGAMASAQMSRFQRSQDTLYALAKDTGGKALFDYNDLSLGIVQAAESQTSYYIVGYYSTHTANDGKFRRVKVSLAGTLAGELTYRAGYYADKEWAKMTGADRERQLEEALMLDNPVTEITIALELNYFQLNSAEYFIPVAVKIPGSELALASRRGAQRTTLDFIVEVKDDPYGFTQQNMRDKLDIRLTDKTAAQLANQPIQYETGFTLLPGKYIIKFLARDAEAGRIGTYQTSFTVPNLDKEQKKLPISTVVLSSQREPLGAELHSVKTNDKNSVGNPLIYDGAKLMPSVTRVFSTARDLYVYLQAYERYTTENRPLVAFVSFYQGDVKVFETEPLAVVDGMEPRSRAVPLKFTIPLQSVPPGRYDCQVTVLEPAGQRVAFWQAPIVLVP